VKQHRHAAYQKVGVVKTRTTIHEDGGVMCPCEHIRKRLPPQYPLSCRNESTCVRHNASATYLQQMPCAGRGRSSCPNCPVLEENLFIANQRER
jgi:hypothetical protein